MATYPGKPVRVLGVLGGSRGVGRAIAVGALRSGWHVAVGARNVGSELASEIAQEADNIGRVQCQPLDIAIGGSAEQFMTQAARNLGPLSAVVITAAVSGRGLLVDADASSLDVIWRVNLDGVFFMARAALLEMARTPNGGTLILFGSIAARGMAGNAIYAVSKGALEGLFHALVTEAAEMGVRVHLLRLGYAETTLSEELPARVRDRLVSGCPAQRPARLCEIARAALLLADSPLHGLELDVTGGLLEIPG